MGASEEKEQLRAALLKQRSHIPEPAYLQRSSAIIDRLRALPEFTAADTVHCYVSLNERREVNTRPLLMSMLNGPKKVVVPVTQMENGTLRHVHIEAFSDLHANEWGVPEPTEGEEVGLGELDLIVVPMVGADRNRNRIGYGKGFYDRFLARVDCPTVGLVFEQGLVPSIPAEPFDVPLDYCITEQQII